jgi:indole-3-pyruvate monooxygenase
MISYLEAYARQFDLAPRLGQEVVAARRVQGFWEVQSQDTRYQALNLVIATGYNRVPILPSWPGQDTFRGSILHSSKYQNGEPFRGRKVLVVGFGNSGGEIAIDLWEHGAHPSLAVRSPVNVIPRDLLGIPILAIGILQSRLPPRWADALNAPLMRIVMGDLTRYGLRKLPQGPLTQIERSARIPLIDVGTIKLLKRGLVKIYPGIESFAGGAVRFTDGRQMEFDAVVLATGYRPRVNAFLEESPTACDGDGTPRFSGPEAPVPGLYFCGFHVSPTGMLREIALEARGISAAIADNAGI